MDKANKITNFVSGKWERQVEYQSFYPEHINLQWLVDSPQLQTLLSEADRKLGELNAFSQLIPDIDFFVRMHVAKEATTSSRIEGTQTNMEEALLRGDDILPEKRDDWEEVQNYIKAINFSISQLLHLPISSRLIKDVHRLLLQGVRGEHKQPGEYRRSQNWIGGTLKDATYIPPHFSRVDELMSDLEMFVHNTNIEVPHLIKIGIIHYQFETIHPFLDGNGRMGRLLITLYLVSNGLLHAPSLYLSDFFEKNKTYYYDNLHRVRTHNDLNQWLRFFLAGIIETSENSIQAFKSIIALRDKVERELIPTLGSKAKIEKANRFVRLLYKHPIVNNVIIREETGMETSTINRLIKDFQALNILKEMTGFKRNRMFVFSEYFNLF